MKRWIKTVACLAGGFLATGWASAAEEWVSLFDGKTMSGWEYLEMAGKDTSKWEVVNGAMVGTAVGPANITTNRSSNASRGHGVGNGGALLASRLRVAAPIGTPVSADAAAP